MCVITQKSGVFAYLRSLNGGGLSLQLSSLRGGDVSHLLAALDLTHLHRNYADGLLLVGHLLGLAYRGGDTGLSQVLRVDGHHHLLPALLGNTEAFQQVVVRRYNVV